MNGIDAPIDLDFSARTDDQALMNCSSRIKSDGATGECGRRAPAEIGHLPFLIKRDGTWLYRGTPINRK